MNHTDTGIDGIGRGVDLNFLVSNQYFSLVWLVKTIQNVHQGRFTRPVFPKQGIRDRFLTFIGRGNEPSIKDLLESLSMSPAG